jgi:CRISPR-associated protein Cas6
MTFATPSPDPAGSHPPASDLPARVCEVRFPIVRGRALEVDHAHGLYGALKGACPLLADLPGLGIHPVRGVPGERGELRLQEDAEVRLRLPAHLAEQVACLEGCRLKVQGRLMELGRPSQVLLAPFPALWARTVTLHFRSVDHAAAREQLRANFVEAFPWGTPTILRARTLRIHGQQILGFEMAVRNLDPRASLSLQAEGFGGRRAFGCGLFVPARRGGADPAWERTREDA